MAEAKVEWEKEVMAQVSTLKFSFEKWPNYFRKISVKASYRIASTLSSSEILTNARDYFRALTTAHEHSKTPKAFKFKKVARLTHSLRKQFTTLFQSVRNLT